MYTKGSRAKKIRLQELHEIQESVLEDDDENDSRKTNDIFQQLSYVTSNDYRHIEYASNDINIFYRFVYHYFVEGGITNIVLKHVLNMIMLFMTNIFMIYMITYINWNQIINNDCKDNEENSD